MNHLKKITLEDGFTMYTLDLWQVSFDKAWKAFEVILCGALALLALAPFVIPYIKFITSN